MIGIEYNEMHSKVEITVMNIPYLGSLPSNSGGSGSLGSLYIEARPDEVQDDNRCVNRGVASYRYLIISQSVLTSYCNLALLTINSVARLVNVS